MNNGHLSWVKQWPRTPILLLLSVLLAACGGGLSGSGDGGNDKDPETTTLLPPDFDRNPYEIAKLPTQLISEVPASIVLSDQGDQPSLSIFEQVGSAVRNLVQQKLEVALLQLSIDANLDLIIEHCQQTPIGSDCVLDDANIATAYTPSMASWEFLIRYKMERELQGVLVLGDSQTAELEALVRSKIGSPVSVPSGTLTVIENESYRYEFVGQFDLGFGNSIYTLRWSEDLLAGFVSVVKPFSVNLSSLQASSTQLNNEFVNSVLITNGLITGARQEIQLNLQSFTPYNEINIEAQLTTFEGNTRTDIYSLGKASKPGGYLTSEKKFRSAEDEVTRSFHREGFDEFALVQTSSVCSTAQTVNECDQSDGWDIVTGNDPLLWQFFLNADQLMQLENNLTPFDIALSNVSPEMETFILIKRDNLTISFSGAGLIISIPGFGEINFADPESNEILDPGSQLNEYADSILCRINQVNIDNQLTYRSFCAGNVEDIENALVIGESFREGKLVIEWQASAIIDVIAD